MKLYELENKRTVILKSIFIGKLVKDINEGGQWTAEVKKFVLYKRNDKFRDTNLVTVHLIVSQNCDLMQ